MRTLTALALGSVLAVPTAATAADDGSCDVARKAPIEVETLKVTIVPDEVVRRPGTQVAIRIRVTRAAEPGSSLSPYTEATPIELAFVHATLTSGRPLDEDGGEVDKQGWVTMKFNLPTTTPSGSVAIEAEARYATVGSIDCTEPILVETGHGSDDAVLVVRR